MDFEPLLEESDFISLHTPLTPDTHHLIDAEALSKMKRNAVLVNTSRGAVIDLQALYDALQKRDESSPQGWTSPTRNRSRSIIPCSRSTT